MPAATLKATKPQAPTRISAKSSTFIGLDEVVDDLEEAMPNRIILHSVPGWGKTTLSSYLPGGIFLQSRRETGLQTLIGSGAIRHKVSRFPRDAKDWDEGIHAISELNVRAHDYKFLIIDTINGFFEMLKENILITKFSGDVEKFESYGTGMKSVLPAWKKFLDMLDSLREKGIGTLALCHTKISTFKNPLGTDYDRYIPTMPDSIWDLTDQWADMVLFGNYETTVKVQGNAANAAKATKGKAFGGQIRVLHTEHSAAAHAKNRHGLQSKIVLGDKPHRAFEKLTEAFQKAKQNNSSQNESEDLDDVEEQGIESAA